MPQLTITSVFLAWIGWTGTQERYANPAKIGHCDNVLKSLEEKSFQKTLKLKTTHYKMQKTMKAVTVVADDVQSRAYFYAFACSAQRTRLPTVKTMPTHAHTFDYLVNKHV